MASAGEHVVRRRREERERERESEKGAQGAAPMAGDTVAVGSPKSLGVSAKRDYCVEVIYWTAD
jgi:hypothetical protein